MLFNRFAGPLDVVTVPRMRAMDPQEDLTYDPLYVASGGRMTSRGNRSVAGYGGLLINDLSRYAAYGRYGAAWDPLPAGGGVYAPLPDSVAPAPAPFLPGSRESQESLPIDFDTNNYVQAPSIAPSAAQKAVVAAGASASASPALPMLAIGAGAIALWLLLK